MKDLQKYHESVKKNELYLYGNNSNEFMPIVFNAMKELETKILNIEKENSILKQQIEILKKLNNVPPPPPETIARIKKPIIFENL